MAKKEDILYRGCESRNKDGTCQVALEYGVKVSCRENQKLGWCERMSIQKRMLYRSRSEDFKKALLNSGWKEHELTALKEMLERGYKVLQMRQQLWDIKNDLNDRIVELLEGE